MSRLQEILGLLNSCNKRQRRAIFNRLRQEFPIHPLEATLHTKAEVILQAIARASDLTRRMIRGVIAEAAFEIEVLPRLEGWTKIAGSGSFDFRLEDAVGAVRIQVKLQRSRAGIPMRTRTGNWFVVETQKTRRGKKRSQAGQQQGHGGETRPYRFGEFDILAVSMYPSTHRWDQFMYTVAGWLRPDPRFPENILKLQIVASEPNDDWTDDLEKVIVWFRAGIRKTIQPI
jgi:hypothetical protein